MINNRLVVGIDFNEKYTQISVCHDPSEGVITYSRNKESEDFRIPVAAFKVPGSEKWVFGDEAVHGAAGFKMKHETDLLEKAFQAAESRKLLKDSQAIHILGKYISYLLKLPLETSLSRVNGLCITQREVHPASKRVFEEAVRSAGIGIPSIKVISYSESFFFYALSQPIGLWRNGALLYDYSDNAFESDYLDIDHGTAPVLVRDVRKKRDGMTPFYGSDRKKLDEKLVAIAMEDLKKSVSGTYLTGEAFNERWEQKTLRYICTRSRVFKGQNLYSKGACYAAADEVELIRISKRYLFLGKDSLTTNVSIRAISGGREVLLPIADAGGKWYDQSKSMEVLLGHDRELIVVLTDIIDRSERNVVIRLDWMPSRPERASRIRAEFEFQSEKKLTVTVTDLGFGEIFRATGEMRKEEILL